MSTPPQKKREAREQKAARQREVAALMLAGVRTQEAIAARLGVHQSTISRDCRELERRWRAAADDDIEVLRGLTLARLDEMLEPVYPAAKRGNLKAQMAVHHIIEQQRAILGLDAPRRLAGADGGALEIAIVDARERLLTEVRARRERLQALPPLEREDQSA